MGTAQSTALLRHEQWQPNLVLCWLIGIGLLQIAAGIASIVYGWPLAVAPAILVAFALALFFPRLGLLLLMAAMFSKQSLPGTDGIYASDVLSVPVVAGALIRRFTMPSPAELRNPLRAPMIAIAIYFGLTILWAIHPLPALVNWLRHLQLIVLGLLIAETVEIEDMPKILGVMVAATFVISVYTINEFAEGGGKQRVFGPAGWFFNTFLAMAMTHASVGAVLSDRRWARLCWMVCVTVCFLGLIATQTRSAMLQAVLGILIAVVAVWMWARWNKKPRIRRRIVTLVTVTSAMILIFLFGQIMLFETSSGRVEEALEGRSNTIMIRLLLWKTGWTVFTDSPILGVGLGQASGWSEQFNYYHLDPASPRAGGLGVHNDAITYLAETGIVGTILILWLFWVVSKMGWRLLTRMREQTEARQLLVLLAPAGAIMLHYFYSAYLFYSIGGMIVAYYFGMLTRLYTLHNRPSLT